MIQSLLNSAVKSRATTAMSGATALAVVIVQAIRIWNGEPINYELLSVALPICIALLFARDNNVSSEQAGAE